MVPGQNILQDAPSYTTLDVWQDTKCAYVSINAILSLYSCFRFSFKCIQRYPSNNQEHTLAYSEPCVSLLY